MTDSMASMNEHHEWVKLSLQQVSASFGVESETIIEIVNEGIIHVQAASQGEWQFDDEALRRIRIVLRLQHDLGVNLPGAGLAIDLLEEIARLRQI